MGFTLVEQAIVLSIVAIIAALGWPSLHASLSSHQLGRVRNDFVNALQYARITAIREGARMVVCPSQRGDHCEHSASWEQGYLVEREDLGEAGIRLIRTAKSSGTTIHALGTGRSLIRFQADGSAAGSTITLIFCKGTSAAGASVVVISNSGRIRSASASADEGHHCALSTG